FFFQAEDGIRDFHVTGVQTCALPISYDTCRQTKPHKSSAAHKMLPEKLHFSPHSRRLVDASFTVGHITSNAGLLPLREVDRQHRLPRRLSKIVPDRRDPGRVQHGLQTLLAQRIYALAAGYEDLNDHDGLRHDYALQTAVNRLQPLAGKSTLGRLEQQADRETVVQAHRLLWEHF